MSTFLPSRLTDQRRLASCCVSGPTSTVSTPLITLQVVGPTAAPRNGHFGHSGYRTALKTAVVKALCQPLVVRPHLGDMKQAAEDSDEHRDIGEVAQADDGQNDQSPMGLFRANIG